MVEKWEKLNSERLADYRIFQSRRDVRRSPRTGKAHTFFVLESPDWMNVIPLTPQGEVVLIHQFRHGTAEITLEIPGGQVDPGETPLQTAQRELLEETGYRAQQMIPLGQVTPNPAFLDNRCHTFLALDVVKVQQPHFEGTEDIVTELRPLSEIPALIGNGRITHALVVAAFYHLERYQEAASKNKKRKADS